MDGNNPSKNFEAIFKIYNERKPLALYCEEEKQSTLCTNVLKPQDVIATVSKQLKEIQKADTLKNTSTRGIIKSRQSDFIPINLYSPVGLQYHHIPKFETQCVTDTQLIDIVDNVEAMVNQNINVSKDFQSTASPKEVNSNEITIVNNNVVNICGVNNNTTQNTVDNNLKDFCDQKHEPCIDEVNTEIYQEFNMSYSETHNNNTFRKNRPKESSIQHCNSNKCKNVIDNIGNCAGHNMYKEATDNNDNDITHIQSYVINKDEKTPFKEKCSKLDSINIEQMKENRTFGNGDDINEKALNLKNRFSPILHENLDTESNGLPEENEFSSSPIFKSFKSGAKSNKPSPLIFSLDSFEKFESVAMPLIEGNVDFHTAKYLISSQIKDNQPADVAPIFQQTSDSLIIECGNCNKQIVENGLYKFADTKQQLNTQVKTKSTSFEDEILFSSDEDDEHFHNYQDLPLTCALKTSFYEPEIDLNETIFVGFQTSSDKSIQVSKESFIKAKKIFDVINKENNVNFTVTELVDIYNSNEHLNNSVPMKHVFGKDSDKDYKNVHNLAKDVLNTTTSENGNIKVLEQAKSVTFKTANGKSIGLSENSLLTCNNVFKDIEDDKGSTTNVLNSMTRKREFMGFKTASNKKIKISEESLAKTDKIFENIDLNLSNIPYDMGLKIKTEDTQAVKNLNTSESTILIVESKPDINDEYANLEDHILLEEFENESIKEVVFDHSQIDIIKPDKEIKNYFCPSKYSTNLINNNDSTSDSCGKENFDPGISVHNHVLHLQNTPKVFGFKTANNKEIKVSSEALAKTKDLFHDIGFEDLNKRDSDCINKFGCKSKECDVLIERSVRKLTNENDNNCPKVHFENREDQQPIFQELKNVNNEIADVSKKALFKSDKIFQDIVSISASQDNASTKNEEDFDDNVKFFNTDTESHLFTFQGFKTANNNSVNVSDKAVTKNKKVLQDILSDINILDQISDANSVDITNPNTYYRNIEKPINLGNYLVCNEIAINVKNTATNITCGFPGFKTASDKPVIVSKESLLKTKNIFESIDYIGNDKNIDSNTGDCIYLNERSSKNELVNVTSEVVGFPGFKTASDKEVAFSNVALAKTKHVFKDLDYETNISTNKDKNGTRDYSQGAIRNVPKNTAENIINQRKHNVAFTGFQTASNKSVKISDEAMERSRKLFEEISFDKQSNNHNFKGEIYYESINDQINKKNVDNKSEKEKVSLTLGFKTATNKPITISDDLLKKSTLLFSDESKMTIKPVDDLISRKTFGNDTENNILHNTLNTQLLNHFEETLHTEDFYNDSTLKDCKRSGSPILSCPKAKKRRKFETPYKSNISENTRKFANVNKKSDGKYIFLENYKKTKLYSLKDLDKSDENPLNAGVDPYILNFDFDTLLKFEFESSRNDFLSVKWTTDNIKTCFLESVERKIIPEGWLDNHLKLILWKLISYEVRFSKVMRGIVSVKNVLEQLKYRYDKELYRVERPALRKLLEKDDISTRTMILAVVGVYVDGIKVASLPDPSANVELLVTDGWYCVTACADRMLSRLVSEGKIAVGRKIATVGAELLNCEQGVSPWEDTSAVSLKLFGNSTRPARWDARLGFYTKGTILSQLSSIDPAGGKVCKTRVLVVRVYPALYVEKLEDGSTVTRPERLEHLHQIKYESERQNQLEKLYEEVEKEYFDEDSPESEGIEMDLRKSHQSGSQLNRLMKKSNDPSQFRSRLTESQALLLQEYSSRNKDKIVEELQKRVQDKMRAKGLQLARNVIPLLKIRVAGFEGEDTVKVGKGMVSIWRPNDAVLDVVKEGTWIDMFNVIPTAFRNSEIQISAGRQSIFHRSKYKEKDKMKPYIESLQRKCFSALDLNKVPTMQTDFNEIDTAGVVFLIEPSLNDFDRIKGQQFQNVYLTDVDKNFICINFWGGIKKFGYENIFDTGNIVACLNLQKRAGNTRKCILQYRATELTVFTKTPKLDHVRIMTEELIKKMSGLDKRKFCDDCVLIKNNYATIKQGSDFSPYRLNTSDLNLTKNKIFIDSPVAQNKDVNLNLTGLDFDSPFQLADTQELSPAMLKRKQLVKEKIAKLKMYGEPPPLSKIHIVNKSKNAGSSYKSPLISNVTSVKNTENRPIMTSKLIQPSPISSLNRTFVVRSGVNPIKLNFSAAGESDDKMETNPFEEEFEVSPPLSLD